MQKPAIFIGAVAIALAAGGSFLGARLIANYVERSSTRRAETALQNAGYTWARVQADGLLLRVSGPAPSEVARFKALSLLKSTVSAARVRDTIRIVSANTLAPPLFSLELLRNDDGISLIGLIPKQTGSAHVLDQIKAASGGAKITNMLETADFPKPKHWDAALDFALGSLGALPRSKISLTADKVAITAITDSAAQKRQIEARLRASAPKGIVLALKITAPRPVITPFSLRLVKDATGARFDSCSADTAEARDAILAAARSLGINEKAACTVGLGTPSPRWKDAVVAAFKAVKALHGGELTFSDADITLIAPEQTEQADFDRVTYDLEQALPDVFSLHAVLPPKPAKPGAKAKAPPPEFLVTKSPEGLVQMRGRLRNARSRLSVHNFAASIFGAANLHDSTRLNANLPDGWPVRIMVGLQGLGKLHNGLLTIGPRLVELKGRTGRPEAKTEITQLFSQQLGDGLRYKIDVSYDASLHQQKVMPTPQQCVDRINGILKKKQIVFGPASARIDGDSMATMEKIAEAMSDCADVHMEIAGYTDSQGRESMNLTLSQSRAEAVLDTLLSLDVLTNNLTAKGYGEADPIADNKTEEGRKANRRIEFHLIGASGAPAATPDSTPSGTAAKTAPETAPKSAASAKPAAGNTKAPSKKPETKHGTN